MLYKYIEDNLQVVAACTVVSLSAVGLYIAKSRQTQLNRARYLQPHLKFECVLASEPPRKSSCTVLVTGGCGFLGSAIVSLLQAEGRGNTVIVFDVMLPKKESRSSRVTYIKGNVLNCEHIKQALGIYSHMGIEVDCVIHTASLIPFLGVPSEAILAVNVDGTQNLLDECRKKKVPMFIYTSSATAVLEKEDRNARRLKEEDCPYPTTHPDLYTSTKAEAERRVIRENSPEFATCVLRPGGIFGRGDKLIADKLVKGLDAVIIGSGEAFVEHVAVEDVAEAHVLALEALSSKTSRDRVGGQAYFIGSGVEVTYGWVIGDTKEKLSHWGFPPPVKLPIWVATSLARFNDAVFRLSGWIPLSPSLTLSLVDYTQRSYTFSIDKAKRDLNYQPKFTPSSKIRALVEEEKASKSKTV